VSILYFVLPADVRWRSTGKYPRSHVVKAGCYYVTGMGGITKLSEVLLPNLVVYSMQHVWLQDTDGGIKCLITGNTVTSQDQLTEFCQIKIAAIRWG
jgi:hypothetical protein